jgi:hypothetical protein
VVFLAYKVHKILVDLDRKEGRRSLKYGYSLRYGKYAIVYVTALTIPKGFRDSLGDRTLSEIEKFAKENTAKLLGKWKSFEEKVQKSKANEAYFDLPKDLTDFDGYYKGSTLKNDLEKYIK